MVTHKVNHKYPKLLSPKINQFTLPTPPSNNSVLSLKAWYMTWLSFVSTCPSLFTHYDKYPNPQHYIMWCSHSKLDVPDCPVNAVSLLNFLSQFHKQYPHTSIKISKFPPTQFPTIKFYLCLYIIISKDCSIQSFIVSIIFSFVTDRPVWLNR